MTDIRRHNEREIICILTHTWLYLDGIDDENVTLAVLWRHFIKTCTVEVWEWISDFIPHLIMDVITYPCRD